MYALLRSKLKEQTKKRMTKTQTTTKTQTKTHEKAQCVRTKADNYGKSEKSQH